jgi:hypothetical protein
VYAYGIEEYTYKVEAYAYFAQKMRQREEKYGKWNI